GKPRPKAKAAPNLERLPQTPRPSPRLVTYLGCKLCGRRTIHLEDFDLVHAIISRDREDVDIRFKFVILRLVKRIKELEEALT
ncbi:hypothetical protein H5410_005068, partial [Solanum commersonii]